MVTPWPSNRRRAPDPPTAGTGWRVRPAGVVKTGPETVDPEQRNRVVAGFHLAVGRAVQPRRRPSDEECPSRCRVPADTGEPVALFHRQRLALPVLVLGEHADPQTGKAAQLGPGARAVLHAHRHKRRSDGHGRERARGYTHRCSVRQRADRSDAGREALVDATQSARVGRNRTNLNHRQTAPSGYGRESPRGTATRCTYSSPSFAAFRSWSAKLGAVQTSRFRPSVPPSVQA